MNTMIKTIWFMLLVLFVFSSVGYAADISSSGGEFDLFADENVQTADSQSPIGLSPKVEALYRTDGTNSTDTQWYAISTVHPGGNRVYATAQDVNNVYFQNHATGTDLDTSLTKIPSEGQSASIWSDNGWDL